jgi:hypothetical protein
MPLPPGLCVPLRGWESALGISARVTFVSSIFRFGYC